MARGRGTHEIRIPLAELADSIIVDTRGGDDRVTLDYSLGNLLSVINYQWGDGQDQLVLLGADYVSASIHVESSESGTLQLDDQTISYSAEQIQSLLSIDDVSFTYAPRRLHRNHANSEWYFGRRNATANARASFT